MKNTVKRIISVVTMISCLTCSITCSGAMKVEEELAQDRSEAIYQNAEAFLNGVVEQGSIEKTVYLYDLSEEIVAVYYTLQPYGYIIVDGEDGHVIEYSSNCEPLSDLKEHYYYMGPLEIYKKVSGGYQNVISGDVIEISDLAPVDQLYISDTDNTVNDIIDYSMPYVNTASSPAYIGAPIKPFITSEKPYKYCVITAISNALQWLKDYKGKDVYAGNISSINGLCSYLHNNEYVCGACGLTWEQAAYDFEYGGVLYLGLCTYLQRSDVGNIQVGIGESSANDVKKQIGNQRPVLITIPTELVSTQKGVHAVFIYGYQETANTTHYIVNDSYGNNGVYVCCDEVPVYSKGIMYLW